MRHVFARETVRRQTAVRSRGGRSGTDGELLRHAHAGRYFGGLWFKVFSERGPC